MEVWEVKRTVFLQERWHEAAAARKWFLLALIFGVLFLVVTALYVLGALIMPTLLVERWLIGRPLTQFDCVLVEWRNLGAVPINLAFVTLLGVACGLTRYRWRVLPALIALVLISLVAEEIGKKFFALPLPSDMQSGMTTLTCPQAGSSPLLQLQLWLGMAWQAPPPLRGVQDWAHTVSQLPINLSSSQVEQNYSYPSGHAIRWWFAGLLLAWLFWRHGGMSRHGKRGIVRWLCVALTLVISFTGAALQFYVGTHLISDTIAGYLLGTALGCLAIGLLILNEKKRELKDNEQNSAATTRIDVGADLSAPGKFTCITGRSIGDGHDKSAPTAVSRYYLHNRVPTLVKVPEAVGGM